jgi:uncharacterized protein (UPF0335 family)
MTDPTLAKEELLHLIGRIERLEEEKSNIAADLREVYAEAKGNGFDTVILRKIVRLRKQDPAKREEEQIVLDLYKEALGMG